MSARDTRPVEGPSLRHLAICAEVPAAAPESRPRAATGALAKAAAIVPAALDLVPSLEAVSLFLPGLQPWLGGAGPGLLQALAAGLGALRREASARGAGLRRAGRRDRLPQELAAAAPRSPGHRRSVVFYLDYGGRDEIRRAAERALARGAGTLTEEEFGRFLDTGDLPDPDLVIFVGGSLTPRDFLLWQASYAEIWHTPLPWDSFPIAELSRALDDFALRSRRFGR